MRMGYDRDIFKTGHIPVYDVAAVLIGEGTALPQIAGKGADFGVFRHVDICELTAGDTGFTAFQPNIIGECTSRNAELSAGKGDPCVHIAVYGYIRSANCAIVDSGAPNFKGQPSFTQR